MSCGGVAVSGCRHRPALERRHTFAAELCREGVPLNIISSALGHSNAATTARYLDHIAPEQLLSTMRARVWPQQGSAQ